MYFERTPRREIDQIRFKQIPADRHEGNEADFLRRHTAEARAARTAGTGDELVQKLIQRISDTRNLWLAWQYLRSNGGTAPGPNGLRYRDVPDHDARRILRGISKQIVTGLYRPGKHRKVKISKGPGRDFRTLTIQNIEDRVVQRAIVQIVQPMLDPLFDCNSFGFRPQLCPLQAIARADALASRHGMWIWVIDDIRDAFDHVPHARLLDVIEKALPDPEPRFIELIHKVIANPSKTGLRQGGSLSPLLLNLYLHHFLDRKWRKEFPEIPLIRFADDVLLLCRTRDEAAAAYARLGQMLQDAAMFLKGDPGGCIRSLGAGESGDWLGFSIRRGKTGLITKLTDACWANLDDHLALAHEEPDSPIRANQTICGWISQLGPAYPKTRKARHEHYDQVKSIAANHSFDEIPGYRQLMLRWRAAHDQWIVLQDSARSAVED